MSARFLPRERDGPDGRLALQQFDAAPRSGDRQPACELPFQPRNRAEDSAREDEGKRLANQIEPSRHGESRPFELVRSGAQDADRDLISG